MKTRNLIPLFLFSLLVLGLSGCSVISCNRVFPKLAWYWSSDAKQCRDSDHAYVLHDTVENDFWTGKEYRFSNLPSAKHLTYTEANRVLAKMRSNEVGGYANVPDSESKFPIVIEMAVEAEMRERR